MVVCCWLFVVGYLLLVVCCWLFVDPLPITNYPLPITHYLTGTESGSLGGSELNHFL
jgi:hypothetical protein